MTILKQRLKTKTKEMESKMSAMEGEHYTHVGHARLLERHSQGQKSEGCWGGFTKFIKTIWRTKHTDDVTGEEYVRASLRELIIYIMFLLVTCLIAFLMVSSSMYYHKHAIKRLFVDKMTDHGNFKNIVTMDDFWWWVKGPFLDGIYWEKDMNGTDLPDSDGKGTLYFENNLIGRARLRQLRVRNDSCHVPNSFEREIKQCYNVYLPEYEEKDAYFGKNTTAWTYQNVSVIKAEHHWGKVGSYDGGGYVQLLSGSKGNATSQISELFDGRWMDRATRAIFIDFTVYNANINLFCIAKIVFEFPPAGGIVISTHFDSYKLIRYVSGWDMFVLVMEFFFCAFLLYYIVEELIEICKHRLSYFTEFWNWLDILVIAVALVCIIYDVLCYVEVKDNLKSMITRSNEYVDFGYLRSLQVKFNTAVAIMIFISWIKVFKYISFNKTMNQLGTTLHRCAKDVGGFAVMFFIFFLAYAQLGFMIFGTQVRDFSTFCDSMFTLLRTIMGDFDFYQLEKTDRLLGPLFFISYVFFVFFVLLNMFLAIINDTYVQVKEELKQKDNEFEIMDLVKKGYFSMVRKINRKKGELLVIKNSLKNKEDAIVQQDMRENLRTRGFKDSDIEQVFKRFDIEGDEAMTTDEVLRIEHDVEEEKYSLERLEEQLLDEETTIRKFDNDSASLDDFSVLNRRIDRNEHSMGNLLTQMDNALEEVMDLEKKKQKDIEECHFRIVEAKKFREERLAPKLMKRK